MEQGIPLPAREAVRGLIPGLTEYLALVRIAVDTAASKPADVLSVLSAFLFVNHIRDWATKEGKRPVGIAASPFYEAIREIANGTKHLVLTASHHPDLHATEIKVIRGFGKGGYGVGPFGTPYIHLRARRRSDEGERLSSANSVLKASLEWWEATTCGAAAAKSPLVHDAGN